MSRHLRCFLSITMILLLAIGLGACGGDDDPTTPPPGDVDAVPPLVRYLSPSFMDRSVGSEEEIRVYFSEPMDPETVDVTLSSGGAPGYEWLEDNRYLRVSHAAAWGPGEKVTVTVGTGMKDVAGNALPQSFTTTFYTHSPDLVLLDTLFLGGQNSVLLNGEIVLYFSERMNLTSFADNTILEELAPPKAVPGLIYGTWNGDSWTVTFKFDGVPTPNTAYRITVDGSAAQTWDGDALGDDLVIDFTTGSVADETPPDILSVVPAVGAVVPASTDRIVITFTEPLDPFEVEPSEMAAILDMFMSREPVWNDTFDELTVYLQQPLPAGVRLYAVWAENDFCDLAGNWNTTPDSVSFTVSGTADPFPVRDDLKLYYRYGGDGDVSYNLRQTMENISGDAFDRVLRTWENGAYGPVFESYGMTGSSSRVRITGMNIESGYAECTPPIDFLRLPVVPSDYWEGEASLVRGPETIIMDYTVDVSETIYREQYSSYRKAPDFTRLWLDDCFDIIVEYSMTIAGETTPFEAGEMQYYLAPGLGVYGQTQTGDVESDSYLWAVSIDDRYDIDD